jgi:hypothetical protein
LPNTKHVEEETDLDKIAKEELPPSGSDEEQEKDENNNKDTAE